MSADLAGWLLEQIDWEEHRIQAGGPARLGWATYRRKDRTMGYTTAAAESGDEWVVDGVVTAPDSVQVVYDPAKRLAECDAKRRIIALHPQADQPYAWMCGTCGEIGQEMDCTYPCDTLRLLALPYADRPGYREEWKP